MIDENIINSLKDATIHIYPEGVVSRGNNYGRHRFVVKLKNIENLCSSLFYRLLVDENGIKIMVSEDGHMSGGDKRAYGFSPPESDYLLARSMFAKPGSKRYELGEFDVSAWITGDEHGILETKIKRTTDGFIIESLHNPDVVLIALNSQHDDADEATLIHTEDEAAIIHAEFNLSEPIPEACIDHTQEDVSGNTGVKVFNSCSSDAVNQITLLNLPDKLFKKTLELLLGGKSLIINDGMIFVNEK